MQVCTIIYLGLLVAVSQAAFPVSTVPSNGDVNPYGVSIVPYGVGRLIKNHILVSNFNNASNLQGTGTTIVDISPTGDQTLFAQLDARIVGPQCNGGVGLTTALVVLQNGWVIVGSLPTRDGTTATATAGCLIILNCNGSFVGTITSSLINGPWDMTVADNGDRATLFITNVLNGGVTTSNATFNKGTVLRLELEVPHCHPQSGGKGSGNIIPTRRSERIIGSGFGQRADPAALVIGPTGVALLDGTLYVADTLYNRLAAIPNALTRDDTAYAGEDVTANAFLAGPLGMAVGPTGEILTANGLDGNLVHTIPSGQQLLTSPLLPGGAAAAGDLFGIAVIDHILYYVNNGNNTLNVATL